MLLSYLYFDLYFDTSDKYEEEVAVVGTVTEIKTGSSDSLVIKVDTINGDKYRNYKLKAYFDYDKFYNFSVGCKVEIKGVIESFKMSESGFSVKEYNASLGIGGLISDISDIRTLEASGKFGFDNIIRNQRLRIAGHLVMTSNKNAGGLLSALLLGEKEYLSPKTELDFYRLGITHILALSGMHLVILSYAVKRILSFFKLKKASTVGTMLFTVLYMILAGMSASIVRSAIMLIITGILYLTANTHDSLTSLFISVFIIVLIEPYAIYDNSLWLSAFATLGVIVAVDLLSARKSSGIFGWLKTSFTVSFFAIGATFAISVLKFNESSIISALATVIFSLLTEAFIYFGLFHLVMGAFLPSGIVLSFLEKIISYLLSLFAELDILFVSLNFNPVKLLSIVFTLLFFGFVVFNIKRKKAYIACIFTFLISLYALALLLTVNERNLTRCEYTLGQTENILISDSGSTAFITVGNHTERSAYQIKSELNDKRLSSLDSLVYANYSYSMASSLEILLSDTYIDFIYIPAPKNEAEIKMSAKIKKLTDIFVVNLIYYSEEDIISVGSINIVPVFNEYYEENKVLMFTVFHWDKAYTYVTPEALNGETKAASVEFINESDVVIIGRRGTVKNYIFNYELIKPKKVIIASFSTKVYNDALEYYGERLIYTPERTSLIH